MLNEVQEQLPAFEKGITISVGNGKTVEMNKKQEQLYEEYRLIQYDIVSGKQYSLENQFLAKRAWDKITLDFCPRLKLINGGNRTNSFGNKPKFSKN